MHACSFRLPLKRMQKATLHVYMQVASGCRSSKPREQRCRCARKWLLVAVKANPESNTAGVHSGSRPEALRRHSGRTLEALWRHSGTPLMALWRPSGGILEALWAFLAFLAFWAFLAFLACLVFLASLAFLAFLACLQVASGCRSGEPREHRYRFACR